MVILPGIEGHTTRDTRSYYQRYKIILPEIQGHTTRDTRSYYQRYKVILPAIQGHTTSDTRSYYQRYKVILPAIYRRYQPRGENEVWYQHLCQACTRVWTGTRVDPDPSSVPSRLVLHLSDLSVSKWVFKLIKLLCLLCKSRF